MGCCSHIRYENDPYTETANGFIKPIGSNIMWGRAVTSIKG